MNVALHPQPLNILNILSICTGGAGLDLGVELAIPSARSVCMVEREAFAVATLVSAMEEGLLHPAPVWSDARTFDGRAWRGAVDGLIGGIPCQPHSLAGRKQGSNDARDLWSTARRIIVQSGAWFVVIENVGGMLAAGSDEIAGAQRVFRDLHKLGFETEGGLFTAAEVGASHQRERIIILAVADRGGDGQLRSAKPNIGTIEPRQQASRWDHAERRDCHVAGVGQADAYSERLERVGADIGAQGRTDARGPAGLCDGAAVEHPDAGSSQERKGHEALCARRAKQSSGLGATGGISDVVYAFGGGCAGRQEVAERRSRQRTAHEWAGGSALFPPGPADVDQWRAILARSPQLEPAFRRVADGLASRMDIGRVDRLRMLGNGVVPLQAAYALRTLVTRLAARGSAGAARLVRLMEVD